MNSKTLYGIVIVLLIGVAGYFAYQNYLSPASQAADPTSVPAPTANPNIVSAEGKVVPNSTLNLGFTQAGEVAEVLVQAGNSVKAGDVLARLDPAPFQAAVDQAQASLDAAKANVQSAQVQLEQAQANAHTQASKDRVDAWNQKPPTEITQPNWYFDQTEQITATQKEVDKAQAALQTEQANLQSVLKKASSANLVAAETRLADAQTAFLDAKDVLDRANSSGNSNLKDQAQTSYDAAKGELDAAQKNYDQILTTQGASDVLEARARVAVAQERYDTALDRLNKLRTGDQSLEVASAQQSVQQAQTSVSEAEASLKSAQVALSETTVVAPTNGTIAQVDIHTGEVATPGREAFILADTSSWKVETTDLAETDVPRIKPGMQANITMDAFPNRTFSGQVKEISLVSEDTRGSVTYQVTLTFDPGDANVRWGMTAYADIHTQP